MTIVGDRAPSRDAGLDAALDRLSGELDRWQVPGAEVAVVRDGEVLFAGGLGVRGVDDATPVGPSTLFHHGSCGKAYTALAAASLGADGVLDLDAPVRRYVPELRLPDMTIADRITTRDLLSHRSGLARHDLVWIAHPQEDAAALLERLEHLPLAGDLRAGFVYSNLGYALAGMVIGRAAGSTWDAVLHERVLAPAGMTRTWVDIARTRRDPDHAEPHIARDGKPVPTLWRPIAAAAPAGEVMTCATDAARWLLLHTGADVVPAAAVAQTHQLHTPVPAAMSPFAEMRLYGYGLGWLVATWRDRPMLAHTGGIDGMTTHTLVLPAERIGVTVSVNQHLSSLAISAAMHVADVLFGAAAQPSWFDRLHTDAADAPPAQRTPDDTALDDTAPAHRPSHELTAYQGVFGNAGYGELIVGAGDDGLTVRFGELELEVRHRGFDTWDLHYDPLDLDAPLTFAADPDGAVVDATVRFDGEAPVVFTRRPQGD